LIIEDSNAFTLHFGLDGWSPPTIQDRSAQPLVFGMFGVTFTADELNGHSSLEFVRRYPDGRWESPDRTIKLNTTAAPTPSLQLPRRVSAPGINSGQFSHSHCIRDSRSS
jgi:hypothetical protein